MAISGGVDIARRPGAVQLSMLVPLERLDRLGLGDVHIARCVLDGQLATVTDIATRETESYDPSTWCHHREIADSPQEDCL